MTRAAFSYFGGKYYMLKHLLPLIPPHRTFVEVFAGAAWLSFAKPPSKVEVISDVDQGVTNFYRVLRDPEQAARLIELLEMTPRSRVDFHACRLGWSEQSDPVEKARQWYVTVQQGFSSDMHTDKGWSYSRTQNSGRKWQTQIANLSEVHARLSPMQIDCLDFRLILRNWDSPDTCFYCDPPYIPQTRKSGGYTAEMSAADHEDLVARLLTVRGMVLLSGYAHPLYAPLDAAGWERRDYPMLCWSTKKERPARTESVWINPAAQAALAQTQNAPQKETIPA